MSELRVLVTCRQMMDVLHHFEVRLKEAGVDVDVAEFTGQAMDESALRDIIHRYDGVIAGDDPFTSSVLREASRLRIISKWGIGLDGIDRAAAAESGIVVTNTPGVFSEEVADITIGYLIMLARGLHLIDAQVRNGSWPKVVGRSLAGTTLGVHPCDRTELFERSDALALNCPLTSQTRHLVNAQTLALARPGLFLVNTGRGGLVDESALVDALASGRVHGAALDVFEREPLPERSALRHLPGVILGSHNASNTREAGMRASAQAVDNLLAHLGVPG